jgi:hypothetical protein
MANKQSKGGQMGKEIKRGIWKNRPSMYLAKPTGFNVNICNTI